MQCVTGLYDKVYTEKLDIQSLILKLLISELNTEFEIVKSAVNKAGRRKDRGDSKEAIREKV